MKTKPKTKRKIHKTSDPDYDIYTYSSKSEFDIEWIRLEVGFSTKIVFLYKSKESGEVVKYRFL